jgi:peptide-methionine (R)-S-oxide reductase
MIKRLFRFPGVVALSAALAGCYNVAPAENTIAPVSAATRKETKPMSETVKSPQPATEKLTLTDEEWRKKLSPEEYQILRQKGTERAFTGKYWNLKDDGTYTCAGCGEELFKSSTKFDSGCGWPSFYDASESGKVEFHVDTSHGMRRTEVTCAKCGGHLGHVFEDGPKPTGQRYCINSASIQFHKSK